MEDEVVNRRHEQQLRGSSKSSWMAKLLLLDVLDERKTEILLRGVTGERYTKLRILKEIIVRMSPQLGTI